MLPQIFDILQLPPRCILDRKLPKTFFKRNFELTTSEQKVLDDPSIVAGIHWLASISPFNANITRFEDGQYLYEEVQIMAVQTATTDFEKNVPKIAGLVQKYIPYQILLWVYHNDEVVINTAEKRINQNDNTLRTIELQHFTLAISLNGSNKEQQDFLSSIAFAQLDKTNLKTYYNGYTQRIVSLKAASFSGIYTPRNRERTDKDLLAIQRIETLQAEITTLQNLAKKETQLSQQVAINLQVQEKRKQIQQLKTLITA